MVLNEKSQQVDKLEFEEKKLREQASNQKQELEQQLKSKDEEIEHLKVMNIGTTLSYVFPELNVYCDRFLQVYT